MDRQAKTTDRQAKQTDRQTGKNRQTGQNRQTDRQIHVSSLRDRHLFMNYCGET